MTTTIKRIVLTPDAVPERFDAWAQARGWALALELPRGHASLSERVFKPEGDADVAAGWCEDHTLGVRFLWLNGPPEIFAGLAGALPHYDRAGLLARAGSDDLARAIDAMRALTVLEAGRPPSAEFLALYEGFSTHPSEIVRRVAIHLGWVGGWRELAPLVEQREADDRTLSRAWAELAAALKRPG